MPANDLTDALKKSEKSYHDLFNTIGLAIYIQDQEGRFVEVNDGACAMYGYTREEFIGRTPEFLAAPGLNDFSTVTEKIRRAFTGEPQQMEFWGKRKGGEIFPKDVRLYKGSYFGMDVLIVVAADITERKRIDYARRESEERYRRLLEAVTDYVFTVRVQNGKARETVHGPGCEAVTGFSGRDFSRDPDLWIRMVVEEDRSRVIEQAERILKGERVRTIEHRIIDKDGGIRWVTNTLVPRYDETGNLIAYDGIIQDITPRKVVELAFSKSEAQLNAIIKESPIPMFVIDKSHRVISWNQALERSSGIAAGVVLGTRDHWKAFYEKERPCLCDLLIDGETGKIPELYRGKYRKSEVATGAYEATDHFPRLGSTGRWLHFIAAPIIDSTGMLIGAVETMEDITRLVQAQTELRESEERYSALFSNNYSVSLLIDPDTGRIVDVNDAAVRYYGYSRDQLLARGIYDLNRLPQEKVIRNLIRAKNETAKHFQSVHFLADGQKRYVEIYSGPIRVQGKPLFYSIIHDITESRHATHALRESEERYRTLIDQLPDYVIVHRNGILVYVNPAGAAEMSYDVQSLLGKPVLTLIRPEDHETVRRAIEKRMKGEYVPAYEIGIIARDGTFRTVLIHGALIHFDGAPASMNVLTDITTLKQAQEEIHRANEDLERRVLERTEDLRRTNEQLTAEIAARVLAEQETSRSLEEKVLLLREIHHRVKNNLQIVASLLKLQSRFISDQNVLESIKDTQSRVRAMSLVHERIYRSHDISRINIRDYLGYLTKQVFQFYNIQPQQVAISVTMDDVMSDIDTITPLGLIMNELVSNSLKHAFPDGRTGTISIECVPVGTNQLRFTYHDSGIGIPVGYDWKNTESLGLRLVNSLVDQLDGTIDLVPGEGTTFIITIRKTNAAASTG